MGHTAYGTRWYFCTMQITRKQSQLYPISDLADTGSSCSSWKFIALQQMDSFTQSQLYPNSDLADMGNSLS